MSLSRTCLRATIALGLWGVTACQGINSEGADSSLTADESRAATIDQVPQILSAETLAKYRKAAPKVAYGKLQAILNDPDTLWYDHEAMPSAYQDSVEPSATVGCRPNNAGANLINIIPGGRQMFSPDGKTFNFPFGHTAGTDKSTNTFVVDFLWLPSVAGKRLSVAYWIKNGKRSSLTLRQWRWIYPKGTVFGELIFVKSDAGELLPVELRTRERFLSGWATNAYRPFPTAESLAAAIKSKRPSWESSEGLRRAVEHLGDDNTLKAKHVTAPVYPGTFETDGALDLLPDLGDQALVKDLLAKEFVSSYGATWKSGNGLKAFAASTSARFSIVPDNYEAGLIEVRDQSCQRCHNDAQRAISDFNDAAILYGDIWGSDRIFSFHPFDPATCRGAAEDNRSVRPIFKSARLFQVYDPSVHGADYYKELP